jgi:anti-sigma regulatory factor (Ser/Thr protein kinase)
MGQHHHTSDMPPAQKTHPYPSSLSQEDSIRTEKSAEIDGFVAAVYARMEPALKRQHFVNPEFRITLALHEAVINAWRHGNGEDRRKTITVRWQINGALVLEVMDEGSGFDFNTISDPRAPEHISNPRGRGIAIITYLADQVSWQDGGRHLVASFGRIAAREQKGVKPI